AGGTFEQLDDSRESTASRAATVGNILDRPAWWPPCDVRWHYRVVVGGNATCACAARNAEHLRTRQRREGRVARRYGAPLNRRTGTRSDLIGIGTSWGGAARIRHLRDGPSSHRSGARRSS